MDLSKVIRSIPDFPEKGIIFRDITPVLNNPDALKASIDQFAELISGLDFDLIVGPESRGFIFSMPLAYNLHKGFVPVRKKGKLPYKTISKSYDLEYGSATIEIHEDAITKGQKVVVVDDLLATGGTCKALIELLEQMGAEVVSAVFLIELEALNGRSILNDINVQSILKY